MTFGNTKKDHSSSDSDSDTDQENKRKNGKHHELDKNDYDSYQLNALTEILDKLDVLLSKQDAHKEKKTYSNREITVTAIEQSTCYSINIDTWYDLLTKYEEDAKIVGYNASEKRKQF